jgi:hypothetical protein
VKATPITVNYHSWWLADRADGLYAASGALVTRVAGGARDSHVGQEIDVLVNRALTPQLQLQAGYAHVFTGAFLKQATPGASYSYPYVMATYVFLRTSRGKSMKRRTFLKTTTASAAGVLMSGLPSGWVGSVYADDSPETKTFASASSRSPTARRS